MVRDGDPMSDPRQTGVQARPMPEWDVLSNVQEDASPHRIRVGTYAGRVFASEDFRPVLVLGPQRSYKTSGFAIPAILDWGGPAVVTSVRTDVIDQTLSWRQRRGEAMIFDPAGVLKDTKYASGRHSWDLLDDCRTWNNSVRTSNAVTEAGRLGGILNDTFWYSLASQLLAPHFFAAACNGYSMSDVVRWIKTQEESEVRSLLQTAGREEAITAAEASWQREDRAKSSVYSTAESVLRAFDYDDSSVDEPPFIDLDGFLNSESDTLYLCAPPDAQEEFRPLFTGLIRTIIRKLYENNNRAQDELAGRRIVKDGEAAAQVCRLLLMLDEAGNIAPLENLATLATTAAGTHLQLVTIFHDISQIEGLYGPYAAKSIVNNHSGLVVLPGSRDDATIRYLVTILEGERIANSAEGTWNSARPIRGLQRGNAMLVYDNLRPIILRLRSSHTDPEIARRTRVGGD
jgi:type IV secretion system protein VirD4